MTQHLCDVKWGFVIGSKCFVPQPKVRASCNHLAAVSSLFLKVQAVVLKLTPLVKPRVDVDFDLFEKVVRLMFQFRRKFVRRGTM